MTSHPSPLRRPRRLPPEIRRSVPASSLLPLLLVAVIATPVGRTRAQQYELEQVMSFHFPTGLIASPVGGRIAWLGNEEGRRNVWVAGAPDWRPRSLTAYADDDGQELSSLHFSPDGESLIYLRGGTPNRDGELPNPTSDPGGVSRDLWVVPWNGGEPVRIAGAVSPVTSPARAEVIWASGGQCMLLDLSVVGRGERRERYYRPLFQVRSGLSDLQWSPDGTRIAFASERDGRSILGVYDIERGELTWLTNSVDRDTSPRWSRDGSRLAFLRSPAGGRGFTICRVDVATAETTELWRSPAGRMSSYPRGIAGEYGLMYGDGYLVFAGEWSGWNHLYTISEDGGESRELTPGEGIVENALLSPDGRWVYVSCNTQSIDFRQLARVRLEDGHTEWIEDGEAIAWNPAPDPGGDWLAYIRADAREPASVYLRTEGEDAGIRVSPLPDDFPLPYMVKPEQVVFESEDGWPIHGQLFVPEGLRRRDRLPAVIFMHGGSRRQMLLGWHNRGYYHNAYSFNQYLASTGYVVLSVNYRSGIGYGVEFRNPPDYGYEGASEYQDIVAAARFLQSHRNVDPDRIGLWGGSYGGYLTALGLARNSDIFKAGVDLHGVHNWADQLRWWGMGEIAAPGGAMADSMMRRAFLSSPMADIGNWRSPVLIVHADDDRNVPFEASIDLVAALRRKGDVIFEELFFTDDVHGFLLHRNWLTAYRRASLFFDRYLKEGSNHQR